MRIKGSQCVPPMIARMGCGGQGDFRFNDECRNPNDESITNDLMTNDETEGLRFLHLGIRHLVIDSAFGFRH
jgi:hypothetical protein